MQTKSRAALLVLAALAAGQASAKIQDVRNEGGDASSSLIFVAMDSVGSPVSITLDLGYTFDQFKPAGLVTKIMQDGALTDGYLPPQSTDLASTPGTSIIWNFNNNTTTINGVTSNLTAGKTNDWTKSITAYYETAQKVESRWGVIAGDAQDYYDDGTSIGAPVAASGMYQDSTELSSTIDPSQINFQSRLNSTLSTNVPNAVGNANTYLMNVARLDTSDANTNGAVVATSGYGYAGSSAFNGNWAANFNWTALADEGKTQKFLHLVAAEADPSHLTSIDKLMYTVYPGVFKYADGILSYQVAEVPEPQTMAMMLLGLLGIAGVARRRGNC